MNKKPKNDPSREQDKLAEKIDKLAHSMTKEIQGKMNPAVAGQNPTPRRIAMAASMREDGERMQLAQAVLFAVADCKREGAPVGWPINLPPSMRWLNDCTSKKDALIYAAKYGSNIKKAMKEAGVAPREDKEAKVKAAINELCGNKIDGFFPTPAAIADRMVELADFPPGLCTLLEPSAGYGALVDAAIRRQGDGRLRVTMYEVNYRLFEILTMKQKMGLTGSTSYCEDFIEHVSPRKYDRVLMNPPFENKQDMMHVQVAYDALTRGGVLVAIVSEGCFFRTSTEHIMFREWLEDLNAETIDLPASAFTGTIRTTNVKARILKLVKP